MIVRRIARPLLAAVFVTGGIETWQDPAGRAKAAGPVIDKIREVLSLPESVDTVTIVKVDATVKIVAGGLLAANRMPRLASLALAASLVPTTIAGHAFWAEEDPDRKVAQRTHFMKNVSLLGGLILAAVDTEGKPSVAYRARQAAGTASERASDLASSVGAQVQGLGSRAAEAVGHG